MDKVTKGLASQIGRAYVICAYLRDLRTQVGDLRYKRSFVRLEHGTGTGFFGVSNSGSADCAKECFRKITDALGQSFKSWRTIEFRSDTCVNLQMPRFDRANHGIHRVEHTLEVIQLFRAFEDQFILAEREFSAPELAEFVILNQIVCLIQRQEQVNGWVFDAEQPFGKYNRRIYFRGSDVSTATWSELIDINRERYRALLDTIRTTDFIPINQAILSRLHSPSERHTLPPMSLAVNACDCEFELLHHHYRHKRRKRTRPASSWYDEGDSRRYADFLCQMRQGRDGGTGFEPR